MAVTSETSKSTYTGNAATVAFPTDFYFLDNSEVVVKVTPDGGVESTMTEGLDYELDGAGEDAGGTVTFDTAPAVDDAIVIERTVPFKQLTNFAAQGSFDPETHERSMDELEFQIQQLNRRLLAIEGVTTPPDLVVGNGLILSGSTLSAKPGTHVTVDAGGINASFDNATIVDDGLMSSEDKALLDALVAGADQAVATIQTTDATETLAATITPTDKSTEVIELSVVASKKTLSPGAGYTYLITVKRYADVCTIIGIDPMTVHETPEMDWNVRIAEVAESLKVYVTGGAYLVDWAVFARRRRVYS